MESKGWVRRHASGLKRCREGQRMLDHSRWVNQTTAFHFTWLVSQLFTGFPPGFHGSHSISLWKAVLHRAPGFQPSRAPCWMDSSLISLYTGCYICRMGKECAWLQGVHGLVQGYLTNISCIRDWGRAHCTVRSGCHPLSPSFNHEVCAFPRVSMPEHTIIGSVSQQYTCASYT